MIRFNFGHFAGAKIHRPTWKEIAALVLLLAFVCVLVLAR